MRSIPLLPAVIVTALSLPALAATGEREAQVKPSVLPDGGAMRSPTLPQDSTVPSPPSPAMPPAGNTGAQGASPYAPDNTGRNRQRDTQLEADDQSNNPADVKVVSAIRRALTDDSSLSLQGHNVKLIVQGGRVTLRGPVKDAAEKRKVEAIARKAAGKRQVVNELEVMSR